MASMDGSSVTKGKAGLTAKQGVRAGARTPAKAAIRRAVRRYLCVAQPLVKRKARSE
jgi:hypothetical protein